MPDQLFMSDKNSPVRKLTIVRNDEKPVQNYRFASQLFFLAICTWIGIEFTVFVFHLENFVPGTEYYRPPGVEAFLPISALMSSYYFLLTGVVHAVHPAGFFIFAGIVGMSFIAGKSFCSWVCPVGFLSELTGEFGKKLFRNKLHMPKFLDIPLRSLKYLLLGFFSFSIIGFSAVELRGFLSSDYNTIADIKLFEFFRNLSPFAFYTLVSLLLLSVLFRNFWCRYLCPYGAFLGVVGLLSPSKITRNSSSCIDCSLCDKACPSRIKVSKAKVVISDECTSCMACVDACPVKDTLNYKILPTKTYQKKTIIAAAALFIFGFALSAGILSGQWNNKIPASVYEQIYEHRDAVSH